MTKLIFLLVFIGFSIIALVGFFISFNNNKSSYSKDIGKLFLVTSLCYLAYSIRLYTEDQYIFYIFHIVTYFLKYLWMLLFFKFVVEYFDFKISKLTKIGIVSLFFLDVALCFINIFFNFMGEITITWYHGVWFYFYNRTIWTTIYHILPYTLFVEGLVLVIRQRITTSEIFRFKYNALITVITPLLLSNLGYMLFGKSPINYALFGFIIVDFYIFYFTVHYTQKVVKTSVQGLLTDESRDGYVVFDTDKKLVYANEVANNIFGKDNLLKGYQYFVDHYLKFPADGKIHVYTRVINGERQHFQAYAKTFIDSKDREQGSYFVCHDVTGEVKNEMEKNFRETHDLLTECYNREYFVKVAEKELKDNPNTPYYIIATNFEKFRLFNEMYGTNKGDYCLVELVELLISISISHHFLFGRMGGDSFAICVSKKLFEEIDLSSIILEYYKNKKYYVKIRLGICEIEGRGVLQAYDRAVQTLHYYKNMQGHRCEFYDSKIGTSLLRENHLISLFDASIKNKDFKIYLQPQINSMDETIFGAEALVRWIHPTEGFISPGSFIPVFEKSELISRLDKYVWEEAIKYVASLKGTEYEKLSVSVNVSRNDFSYLDVVDTFNNLINLYDIEPNQIKIEITESAFCDDSSYLIDNIKKLLDQGFIIEMDDFGSGYSSLNVLKDMPINIIKLDMAFLSKNSLKSVQILDAIIALAHRLKLPIIAEGVETKEQLKMLQGMHCYLIQGYYYSKPLAINEFNELLKSYKVVPCLDKWTDNKELFLDIYKELDKYYGLYSSPLIVLKPLYNKEGILKDLSIIYENKSFKTDKLLNFGSCLGRKVTSFKDGLTEQRKETYLKALTYREIYHFKDSIINSHKFNVTMYPLPETDYIVILFEN